MNKKLYNKWIDALNSGQYIPSRKYLRKYDGYNYKYCCLGVLADLDPYTTWQNFPSFDIDTTYVSYIDKYQSMLPDKLQKQVNFTTNNGEFNIDELSPELIEQIREETSLHLNTTTISLTMINDNAKWDINIFPLIAQILRERPPSLFKKSFTENIINWIKNLSASSQLHQTLTPN